MDAPHRSQSPLVGTFDAILARVVDECRTHYDERLIALAVFGSVGRGTPRPDSDVDLLLVIDPLPDGRIARMEEFAPVELSLAGALRAARERGVATSLSPVLKTTAEIVHGSPLLLDMTDDARVLVDRDGALERALERLRVRLAALGAKRVWSGNAWYWDLKPDYVAGEVFEL